MYPGNYPLFYAVYPTCMYCNPWWENEEYSDTRQNYQIQKKARPDFTAEEAYKIGRELGIDFNKSKFDVEQFRIGLNTELEHGRRDPSTNVTNDNPILTGKIALAHLNEFPDYYTRLTKLEEEAKTYWSTK